MNAIRHLLITSLLICTSFLASSEHVYQDIYQALAQHQHRLPGSDAYQASLQALESLCKEHRLKYGIQTYNTIIPETVECGLVVDGTSIDGIYPVQPNIAMLTTTHGNTLNGPLVYLTDTSAASLNNKPLKGAIVLLDITDKNSQLLYTLGVQAIIYVSTDEASQWDLHHHGIDNPISLPRAYISKHDALRQGILSQEAPNAGLRITTRWKSVVAKNLWVHLPKNDSKEDVNNAILLSADYSTFGFVPDHCPQLRDAANTALLAQCMIDLSNKKRARDIIITFLGSHYSAQEGSRYVYWAAKSAETVGYYKKRQQDYLADLEHNRALSAFINKKDFFTQTDHPLYRNSKKSYRQILEGLKGNIESQIYTLTREKNSDNEALIQKLRDEKNQWQDLLGDIMRSDEGTGSLIHADRKKLHQTIVSKLNTNVEKLISEISLLSEHNKSHTAFSEIFKDKRIVLHFAFDFSHDNQPWIHNFAGDHSGLYSQIALKLTYYSNHIKYLNETYQSANPNESRAPLIQYEHSVFKPQSLCTPYNRSFASTCAISISAFGYNLTTVGDPLHKDNLPVRHETQLSKLAPSLCTHIAALSYNADIDSIHAGEKIDLEDRLVYGGSKYTRTGIHIDNLVKGSSEIEGPSSNAILTYYYVKNAPNYQPGHSNYAITMCDTLGYPLSPHMIKRTYWETPEAIALCFDEYGSLNRICQSKLNNSIHLKAFYAYGGASFVPLFPTNYENFIASRFFKGKNNSSMTSENAYTFENKDCIGIYSQYIDDGKIINDGGLKVLGGTDASVTGLGIPLSAQALRNRDLLHDTSQDLVRLNESRLAELRKRNIILEDVEILHANAKDNLEKAVQYQDAGNHDKYLSHNLISATQANHAYRPLISTTNDMIIAVVILLIISIPFSFSLERLFFCFTSIYKQVGGFLGFFICTFVLLYFAHPAFSLASSPIIIFLAFVIILMSGMVIFIIMGKFKREILALQGLQTSSHNAQTEGSTLLASVVIGISTMRNRPLKTFLTVLTIVLLTFTILVFASFGSAMGIVQTHVGQDTSSQRIEIKRPSFLELPPHLSKTIDSLYNENYHVINRGMVCYYPYDKKIDKRECIIYVPGTKKSLNIQAIMGFDAKERTLNKTINGLYPTTTQTFASPIYLPPFVAKHLELNIGDEVKVYGKSFNYAGIYNHNALKEMTYLDGTKITPPDYQTLMGSLEWLETADARNTHILLSALDVSNLRWTPEEEIALINFSDLDDVRGFHSTTLLYPKTDKALISTDAANLAEIFEAPIYAKNNEGIKNYFFTQSFDGSGANDILIPLILGGLIIFSSLLGSIVDREREIFTFSALGLAPPNIAALFFAESSVYAVIGGLGGYIVSQLAAVFLAFLADIGVFDAPDMNFSSLSSTYTILLVMATVILSTIYPAIKAGKSANPGIARKWQMPTPEGDDLIFVFPFTVGSHDLGGILHFIGEHFRAHEDASLGKFAAADVQIQQIDTVNFQLSATISLAPFDLGIFQEFSLRSQASDIEGILEVVVSLKRVSGSPSAWLRSNRPFIDDLRNQFLVWRSLPAETVAHYTQAARDQESASDE